MAEIAASGWTPIKIVLAAVGALVGYGALKWWRTVNNAPDPSISAPLLDYVFADGATVIAKGTDTAVSFPKLQRADIATVTGFECFDHSDDLAWGRTARLNRPAPSYECAYSLTGTDGASYVTVVHLVYLSDTELAQATDTYRPKREVGFYGVGNVPVDQAVTFLINHGIALP